MNQSFLKLLFFFISFGSACFGQENHPNTLLFEITGNGNSSPSYIYGTMHIKDVRAFDFQDSVLAKLQQCDAFAMEVLPDSIYSWMFDQAINKRIQEFIFEDEDEEIKIDWTDQDFEKIFNRASKKMGKNIGGIDKKDPQLLNRIISHEPDSVEKKKVILDIYFFDLARRAGLSTHSLEIIDSAYNKILSKNFLKDSKLELKNTSEIMSNRSRYEELRSAYVEGDLNQLLKLMQDTTFTSAQFYEEVLIERNYKMVETIKKLSKDKSTFVTCGAGHLPGKEGILDLLTKLGYTIKPIVSAKTQLHETYVFPEFQYDWPVLEDNITYFKIKTPGKPFPVSVPFIPNDFYVYMNPITQEQFLTMSIGMMQSDLSDKKRLKNFAKEFGGNMGKKVQDVDFYKYKGHQGAKVIFKTSYFSRFALDLRMVIREDIIYVLAYINTGSNKANLPVAQKFFNSLEFTNIQIKGWKSHTNKNGAFKANFPGEVKSSTLLAYPKNENEAATKMTIGQDPLGKVAMVMWMDYYYGLYFDNDLEICKLSAESYAQELNIEIKDTLFNYVNGNPHYTCFGELEGTPISWKIVVRGTRVYMLVVSSPKHQDILDYYNSFKLLPYTPVKEKEIKNEAGNFKINLFGKHQLTDEDDNSSYSDYTNQINLESKSFSDGLVYTVSCSEYKKYVSVPDSSYLEQLISSSSNWTDTILTQDTITFKGQQAISILSKSKKGHVHTKSISFMGGNKMYRVFAMGSKQDLELPRVSNFMQSFEFINSKNLKPSIIGDFTKDIIVGLSSKDSTNQAHAISAFSALKDSVFSTAFLFKMVKKDYPNFNESKHNIRKKALYKLNSDSLNFDHYETLISLYQTGNKSFNSSLLNKISSAKDNNQLDRAFQLLLNHPELSNSGFYKFKKSVLDSAHLFVKYADQIIPLLADSNQSNIAIQLTFKFIQDSLIDFQNMQEIERFAEQKLKEEWDQIRIEKATGDYYYYPAVISELIEILTYYPANDFKVNIIESLLKNEDEKTDNYEKLRCYLAQHRWYGKTDYKHIKTMMEDDNQRINTYSFFKRNGLIEILPQKEITNEKLSIGYLSYYYSDDYGPIIDYQFNKELTFTCDSTIKKVNLFELQFEWDSKGSNVWAFSNKSHIGYESEMYSQSFPQIFYQSEYPNLEDAIKELSDDHQCVLKE